jgi:Transposase DDE domain
MATLSAASRHVKEHLEQCLPQELILDGCRRVGHRWRNRVLDPAAVVQLFLLQLLAHVALRGLRRVADVKVSAQALCAARKRLPVRLFHELVGRSVPPGDGARAPGSFKGLKTYVADGLSFTTPDAPALAAKYGKPANQRGTTKGYPAPKLLTLMEAGAGFINRAIILPWSRQEYTCLARLFRAMGPQSLLLGDRGLVSFTHMALLLRQGIHGCFRLPKGQAVFKKGRASRRLHKRQGKQDLLVTWNPARRPKWLGEKRWEQLGENPLTLRQVAFRVCRKGHRTRWAWIITTLLDPKEYPAGELIELYSQRWQVEVYFRDLKRTLGMNHVSARTVAGAQKEVLAFVLLYNLIRRAVRAAARRQEVDPDRISFVDAMLWLLYSGPGTEPPELAENPRRKRNAEPRRLKNARNRFPQLNQSRSELSKPPCEVKL